MNENLRSEVLMKKILLIAILFCWTAAHAQVTGDFQSKASGNWGDVSTWQTYDGSAWNDAVSAPTGTSGTITIQTGHTITVAVAITISSGVNVIVNGYLKSSAAITATTSSPYSFTFNNGSTYEHAIATGSIPMSTWNTGSTCLITGTAGTSPGNNTQPYYNFTWNCPSQSANLNLSWDNVTVGGNLTVTSSGGTTYQFRLTNAATTRTITINGNVVVNGGFLTVSGSSGAAQYNVTIKGNIDIQSGKFNLCGGSGGFGTWRLWGDLLVESAGQFTVPSNTTVNTRLIFAGGATQHITNSGTIGNLNYGIENNSTVILSSPLTVGNGTTGFLVLTSGQFVTTATNLMTLAAGASINTGTGFVNGPLAQTVNVSTAKTLTFPLGKSVYRPFVLNLTQDAVTSTIYNAELFETTPPVNTLPATLDGVSSARYIHIVKGTGANVSSATVQLSYDTNDGVDVIDKDKIRAAKDDGAGTWINLGGSGTANNTGTILSNSFGTSTSLGTLTTNDFIVAHVNPASIASLATLSTNVITSISTTFATSGGVISNDGNAAITAKGVCWNLTGTPTISDNFTSDGTTSAQFTSSITGLTAGTPYYVRAYATNSAGTAYGNEITFTTMTVLTAPVISTNPVTNIVNTSATGSGNITDWGGSTISDRGICWSLSHQPTIANDYNSAGPGGTGTFTAPIGGLTLGNIYYVRAYAINSTGTSYGDEVVLTTPTPMPDSVKVVDKNGTVGVNCDYANLYDAFTNVPTNYTGHWFIYVKKGVYYDKVTLAQGKINVVLIGENRDSTILTYDDYAGNSRTTHGVLSNGTNTSYSVAIDASDFQAQNITFRNTANAYAPLSTATQGVALRVNGDRQSYYNCKMLGYQDTYYTQGGMTGPDRLYHKNCYIEGSVDFIFGRDVALFDSCKIYCNRKGGVLTAGATEVGYTYGYVFMNDTLGSPAVGETGADNNPMTTFYLGRPWQTSPKTVYINCYEPATVDPAGWTTMGPNPSLYSEYGCFGPGAVAVRPVMNVAWPGANQPSLLADTTAAKYTIANIFSKNNAGSGFTYAANWIPSLITFNGILPVEMTSFTAKSNASSINLNWATASELNNSGFEVEKKVSASGNTKSDWSKIGFVKGNGNTSSNMKFSFTDKNISMNGKYSYRLKQIDYDGTFKYSQEISVDINKPAEFKLNQNYPNPFNPTTSISYEIPVSGKVTLKVYDVLGSEVATLVNENKETGRYQVQFGSAHLASGIYMYNLCSGTFVQTRKMILIK
jgi:pectin methylesterase-like acyl-CoA thioesterase